MDASSDMVYLFAAVIASPYGASRRQIEKKAQELQEGTTRTDLKRRQQDFYNIVYQLQRQGFIKKTKDRKLLLTILGREKYKKIQSRLPGRRYEPQTDNNVKVVIFDIPERERHKREWLRYQLGDLGFKMIQKSVWIGKKKLPQEFMEDIRSLKLLSYIEIFAITKTGSIRSVK